MNHKDVKLNLRLESCEGRIEAVYCVIFAVLLGCFVCVFRKQDHRQKQVSELSVVKKIFVKRSGKKTDFFFPSTNEIVLILLCHIVSNLVHLVAKT